MPERLLNLSYQFRLGFPIAPRAPFDLMLGYRNHGFVYLQKVGNTCRSAVLIGYEPIEQKCGCKSIPPSPWDHE